MVELQENGTTNGTDVPEWLNAELFIDFLKENIENYQKVEKFHVVPALNPGENYTTIILRVNIDVRLKDDTIKQLTFMAKVLHGSEKTKDMIRNFKFFDKELNTYTNYLRAFEELYSKAGKTVHFGPKIINVDKSKITEDVLIMENLRRRGFKNANRQEGFDMQHTKRALEKLAQFHAASACYYEENGPYPEIYDRCMFAEQQADEMKEYIKTFGKMLCETLPIIDADVNHLEENVTYYSTEKQDPYQAKAIRAPNEFCVLNHGDCWANNIMFQYESEACEQIKDVYFVDLQMSRYASPAQDLFYMLLSSTSLELKFEKFDYFIFYYHQQLTENLKLLKYGKKLPTLRDLHVALYRNGDWAYAISTGLLSIVLADPSNDANIDSIMSDQENGDSFRRKIFTNKRYLANMAQMLPWMEHRGFLEYKMETK